MRFLFLNTDYPQFMRRWYRDHPGLEHDTYARQLASRMGSLFGVADFYSRNMTALGHPSADIIVNHEPLQRAWAAEFGIRLREARWGWRWRRGWLPWFGPHASRDWLLDVLAAQVRAFKPDVLYCMATETVGSDFLQRVEGCYRLAVGQHAAPSRTLDLSRYDLMVSSLPNHVDRFRRQGLKAEHLGLAFDPSVLDRLPAGGRDGNGRAVHVGGYTRLHAQRTTLLETLCRRHLLDCYGYGIGELAPDSPVRQCHKGVVWGGDMFQVRRAAPINVTCHAPSFAGDYANNMAMYETTGLGSCLVVDRKANLPEIFEPDREVVAYDSAEECAEKVRHLLDNETLRRTIAEAGQRRTLRDHTYARRMIELLDIVKRYL